MRENVKHGSLCKVFKISAPPIYSAWNVVGVTSSTKNLQILAPLSLKTLI